MLADLNLASASSALSIFSLACFISSMKKVEVRFAELRCTLAFCSAVASGMPSPKQPLAIALTAPTVTLGGVSLPVLYYGLAPGEVGVYQINVSVPASVPAGLAEKLVITQGTGTTSIGLRVVD